MSSLDFLPDLFQHDDYEAFNCNNIQLFRLTNAITRRRENDMFSELETTTTTTTTTTKAPTTTAAATTTVKPATTTTASATTTTTEGQSTETTATTANEPSTVDSSTKSSTKATTKTITKAITTATLTSSPTPDGLQLIPFVHSVVFIQSFAWYLSFLASLLNYKSHETWAFT